MLHSFLICQAHHLLYTLLPIHTYIISKKAEKIIHFVWNLPIKRTSCHEEVPKLNMLGEELFRSISVVGPIIGLARIGRIFYLWRQKTSKPDISRLWGYFHLVRMARFERATPCLGGRCSIQLSYIRNNKYYSKNLYLMQLKFPLVSNFSLYSGWQQQVSSVPGSPFSGLLVKSDWFPWYHTV